jgi:hypothetical protein
MMCYHSGNRSSSASTSERRERANGGGEHVGAFVGGLLVGNSAPHLATAVTRRTHLTPLAGKDSSPAVNLVWGLGNALGGLALARACTRSGGRRWDRSLVAFEAGVATFATWMAASEAVLRVNTPRADPARGGPRPVP